MTQTKNNRIEKVCPQCGETFVRTSRHRRQKYCSLACRNAGRRRSPEITAADVERFWSHVDRSGGADACWPWMGAKTDTGYGQVNWFHRRHRATAVAWLLTFGTWPTGYMCHHCDNPACCNPYHLFDGSQRDNMRDAKRKGRVRRGQRHGVAILSDAEVQAIRERYRFRDPLNGGKALAAEYGVSVVTISAVISGKTWGHVPTPSGGKYGAPPPRRIEKQCAQCGKTFTVSWCVRDRAKYCSFACRVQSQRHMYPHAA